MAKIDSSYAYAFRARLLPPVALAACAFFAATTMLEASAAAAPAPKVEICHIPPGNPANFHTIKVSENALSAHLDHGDGIGPCNNVCALLCDDGNACTIDDTGDCESEGCPPAPRAEVDCADGNQCTEDDCEPATGCVNPILEGEPCDDLAFCTANDVCDEVGACTGTPIENCCIGDEDCNETFCDKSSCGVDNQCEPDPPCLPDDVACTEPFCNEDELACGEMPVDALCEDPIDCTVDLCDPENGCQNTPDDSLCGDGIDCTDDECDATGGDQGVACNASPPGLVLDGIDWAGTGLGTGDIDLLNACLNEWTNQWLAQGCLLTTTLLCSDPLSSNECVDCLANAANTVACTMCNATLTAFYSPARCPGTVFPTCGATGCKNTPDDSLCLPGDSIDCTVEKCDPENGGCVSIADDSLCLPGDGIDCTVERCDPENGGCVSVADDSLCLPGDGIDCTVERCDPVTGCMSVADDSLCAEGEICNSQTGCEPDGPDPCFTAFDYRGTGDTTGLQEDCEQNGSCASPRQCTRGNASDCVDGGDPSACDDLDEFYASTGGCNICEPPEPQPSECPCWDGGPQSVPGISNLTELWQMYVPDTCVTDVCTDSSLENSGIISMTTRAECFWPNVKDMSTGVVSNTGQGLTQCSVYVSSSPAVNVQVTLPIGSADAAACLSEHDAFTATIEIPPAPPGGTNIANPCFLADF